MINPCSVMAKYWLHSFLGFFMAIVFPREIENNAYANFWRKTKSFWEILIAFIEYVLLSNLTERTGCSWRIWCLLYKIQVSMTQNHTTQTNHFFSKHIKVKNPFLNFPYPVSKCFQICYPLKGFVSHFLHTNTFSESEKKRNYCFKNTEHPLLFEDYYQWHFSIKPSKGHFWL